MKKCCRSSKETTEGLYDYGVNVSAMQPLSVRWALEPFQRVQQFIILRDGLQPIIMGFVGCVDIILDWNSCLQHSLAVCISVAVSAAKKPFHFSPLLVTGTNTAALGCGHHLLLSRLRSQGLCRVTFCIRSVMRHLSLLLLQETFSMGPIDGIIRVNSALNRDYVVEMSFEIVVQDVDPSAIGVQTATCRSL